VITLDASLYGSHIDANVVKTLTIKTKFASYSGNAGITNDLDVILTPIVCSCAAMAWTAPAFDTITVPTASTGSVAMSVVSDPYIRPPTSDDSEKANVPAFNRCFEATDTS